MCTHLAIYACTYISYICICVFIDMCTCMCMCMCMCMHNAPPPYYYRLEYTLNSDTLPLRAMQVNAKPPVVPGDDGAQSVQLDNAMPVPVQHASLVRVVARVDPMTLTVTLTLTLTQQP